MASPDALPPAPPLAAPSAAEEDERAAQLWREVVDNSVECELCNEPYADAGDDGDHIPRLLSCGHTFCQASRRPASSC